jgi:AsmA protein
MFWLLIAVSYPVENITMRLTRFVKWFASILLVLILLAAIALALLGWNWLRAPIERMAFEKSGRTLVIAGNLEVQWAWPWPRLQAHQVSFANPAWATHAQLLTADAVSFSINLSQLLPQFLSQRWVLSDLHLVRPSVSLELGADGRKNWLLDVNQQDDEAQVVIDRLTLDQGVLLFDDPFGQTHVRAELTSLPGQAGRTADAGVSFAATGQFKSLPLRAQGTGDSVLALQNMDSPYGMEVDATVGPTQIQAQGHVTDLLKLSTVDMQLALRGGNLNELFTLTGLVMPSTHDYVMQGHLTRQANTWRYDRFSGRIGSSDLTGWVQVKTGGKRPLLTADLESQQLMLEDLGPVIGARPGHLKAAQKAVLQSGSAAGVTPTSKRVMPDLPFKFEHWGSLDAEVDFRAQSLRQTATPMLAALTTHLSLKDKVLRLDPLQFGLAGGHMNAVLSLDGRHNPIQATAQVQLRRLALTKLLPADKQGKTIASQLGGQIRLAGSGNSVGSMLAQASGSVALVISGGEISQMVMEKAGMHLWEMFRLNLTGDQSIKLRCAVADFEVTTGNMRAKDLLLDTQVTTLVGSGSISLAQEKLDLTFNQKTKNTSPLALRSPIHVGGNFAQPLVEVDKARMTVRALGALTLGAINPLLMLLPLVDLGPGQDRDCAHWLQGNP